MILELKHIYKDYIQGSMVVPVLKDINLQVEKGEYLAIMGPSGSGKSTLMNIVGCLDRATKGEFILDGHMVGGMKDNDLADLRLNTIGFVFQTFQLLPRQTALDNVALPLIYAGVPKAERMKRAAAALDKVGLSDRMNFIPNQLSGGQRQRVAFARALAPNPQVLLLDEPFAAIDAKVRGELRTWLKELVEKLGITSIFVTHDQDEAVEVADEIIITNHGTIEQMGTPLEIYKSPDTPFVAQFIGHTTVVENYDRLKGFDRIENADKAVIRPEFIKISKSGNLDRYQSAAEEGIVTDVVFRGNRMDITVSINGIEVVGERSLEKDLIAVGEKVHVLIYRLYIFDEEKTYLMENSEMQEQDVFYI